MAGPANGKRPEQLGHTAARLLSYMGRHRFLLLAVAVLVTVSAIANLWGTYRIKPLINRFVEAGDLAGLAVGVAVTAAIYAAGVLASYGYTQIMVRAAQQVVFDIRRDLFSHLQVLPLQFFDTRAHGDLMSLFTNDVDTISDALNNSFAMVIQSAIQMVGTLFLLFVLNWRLSLVVVLGYLAMFLYIRYSGRKSRRFYTSQQICLGELDGYIQEMVAGQKVVKVFNHQHEDLAAFLEQNEKLRRAGTSAQSYAATMVPAVVSISYVNYAVVAVLGGLLAIRGKMDVGSLASYLVFVRQAALPINQFTQQSNFLLSALAGAERIFRTMDAKPEPDEGQARLVNVRPTDGGVEECREKTGQWAWRESGRLTPLRGQVKLEGVDFYYDNGRQILHQINLQAQPGQKIALVGATGAGKTTIIQLLNRFYDVTGGRIVFDGIDVRHIRKADLRRSLGVVLQDTHLFTGTVADNIRYGKLDATRAEVERAAQIANADSFIRRLPRGYDTWVVNDGSNLSQGQRQLLAIARTAIADPPVLILDEATSSIDTRTEALIERGMDQLMKGRTVFVIAHRLSTVRNADLIVVLEHGRIIERGSHEQLLERRGMYYRLYQGMFELS